MNGEQEQENSNCTGELKAVDEDNSTVNTITLSRQSMGRRKKKREKKIREVVLRQERQKRVGAEKEES